MRKLLKFLFSQMVIVSILLILQVLMIVSFIMGLSDYFIYIDLFFKALSLLVIILIINRHSNPTYKLAWIIPIALFPVIGGIFYLFIMGQNQTKRFHNRLRILGKEICKDYVQDENILHRLRECFPQLETTVRNINTTTGMAAYNCADAQYFSTGEEKWKKLLTELEKAEKYIFIEFFIIKEGIMWNSVLDILKKKAAQGVDVRIMYDGMGSMALLPMNYPRHLSEFGIKCRIFSPFTPFLSALQNNRDHRKIVVIDGKTAFTGGINMSDEYINEWDRYGHWKDMGVMLKGPAAFSFSMMFIQLWNATSFPKSKERMDIKMFEPSFTDEEKSKGTGFVMPYHDIPQDNYQTGEFIYLDIINKAKKYVYITTPYLVLDYEMIVALKNAALGGVDVRIICPAVCDHWYTREVAYSHYGELIQSGVKIYEYMPGFIHGKTFCSDDEIAVIGSINLDYRSLFLHFECAAWFAGAPVVHDVIADFEETLKKCRIITNDDCKTMHPIRKILGALLRVFAPLM